MRPFFLAVRDAAAALLERRSRLIGDGEREMTR